MSTQVRPAASWDRGCPTACTRLSLDRGEQLSLPGPPVTGWVLLQLPGPWGPQAAGDSPAVPEALRAAARDRGLRLGLIRRHGQRPSGPRLRAFLASPNGPEPILEQLPLDDALRLPPRALDAVAAGAPSGLGTIIDRPIFLACTHGRRDACCARLGRPVAQALAAVAADRTWESTHIGGCRFAANVVSLPSGVYYGRLSPQDAAAVVAASDTGRIAVPWYRGTAGLPAAARSADAFLRRFTGLSGRDEIHMVGSRGLPGGLEEVEFATPRGRFVLRLRQHDVVSMTVR
ncbi:sucrase ferredoxin [Dactylosporangium vinaceum]|uniref:Sucrase ferredoxin n=1 Tax=Dactylosporangium vinaceum TaxID=53362 RepID=A0ABV5MKP9_9ACTN|nr:sucrase ferredoxin [Dactylosporangium vinaceum]UAB93907.1 sucrase ferredoxin [Dactylosporangium vinaceum]